MARNVKQAVLQKLGSPSEDDAIMDLLPRRLAGVDAELADHAARRQPHACGNEPAAAARRPARGLLPALQGDEILASAFEQRDDKLCAARQLAELLRLPLEEVLSDFDAICDRGWQERGITPEEIREFCVWRGAPMLFVKGQGSSWTLTSRP